MLFLVITCSVGSVFVLNRTAENKVKGNSTGGRLSTLRVTFLGDKDFDPNVLSSAHMRF